VKPIQPDCSLMAKEVRRQLALSQEDLARELGVSYVTVNRWENGQAKPTTTINQLNDRPIRSPA